MDISTNNESSYLCGGATNPFQPCGTFTESNQTRDQIIVFKDDNENKHKTEKEQKSEPTSRQSLFNTQRRSHCVLILCTFASFLSGSSFALLSPFYPKEAKQKGMSEFLVSSVFSVYELAIFISSPIIGTYLTTLGPKFTYLTSIFCGGTSTLLFGVLGECPPGICFIIFSFLCRSLEAVGYSGFITAAFAIVSNEFPDRIATSIGIIETGTSIGYMAGPVIGGALFQVGGFGLPFYIMGGIVLINGAVLYNFLPTPTQNETKRRTSILTLIKAPMVFIPMLSVFTGALSVTFLQPTLANHVDVFGLSPTLIGVLFLIMPCCICICAPLTGTLTDTMDLQAPLVVSGHLIIAVGYFTLGPVIPFLSLEIWTVTLGLSLIGAAYECTLIPTLKCMVLGALEAGFEDNIESYGIICGIFNSIFYLGGVVGPLVGGLFNFSAGTTVVGLVNLVLMAICFVFFMIRRAVRQSK